ncbi:hypothetical protein HMPREF3091_20055 [Hafnia sp. HMSC23F03]|nr:hypothetical protein HMPREF3091_20055 [Hafnia sp. HMSC23F03]
MRSAIWLIVGYVKNTQNVVVRSLILALEALEQQSVVRASFSIVPFLLATGVKRCEKYLLINIKSLKNMSGGV